jgi:HSP20 family protein
MTAPVGFVKLTKEVSDMALVRYEPWNFLNQLQADINRAFRDMSAGDTSAVTAEWAPAVDIEEYNDRFQLYVDLPGVRPEDVDITLEAGVLTLTGERRRPEPENAPAHRRAERGMGRFHRRFILPDSVNADAVNATERNGVLEISIPKQAAALPRRIKIAA